MASRVAGLSLGWHAVENGAPPISPLLDDPPVVPDPGLLPAAHQRWRSQVEADQHQIAARWARQPVWFPVPVLADSGVLPVCGGGPAGWARLSASIALLAARAGLARIRLVNFSPASVFDDVRALATAGAPISVRSDLLSASGSTFDPFGRLPLDELVSLVVDVIRTSPDAAGRQAALQDKRALIAVGRLLHGTVTLGRLSDAIAIALGDQTAGAALSGSERRAIEDYRDYVVNQRPRAVERLDNLQHALDELSGYQRVPARRPTKAGHGGCTVRTLELTTGAGAQERELGRELLCRAVARGFAAPSVDGDVLVVVAAEQLGPEMQDHLAGSAAQHGKYLVLLFGKITEAAERTLGHHGSGGTVFMRLSNHKDAKVAAEYLGREFTFVVNGFSLADGETEQWNESRATSSGTSVSHSTTSTRSSGIAGRTLNFGRSFGSTVSRSFSSNETHTVGTGGSQQRTRTVNVGRVHEYVLEPETFQHLQDDLMLVVNGRTVVLANCDPKIFASPLAARAPMEG